METTRICPSCQKPLPTDVPLGLCPECLIKSGFNTGTEPGNPGKESSFVPPSVEELRKLFPQLEILELIGKGGMGAVYKARQMALDRLVALKILPPGAADDAGFAERFNREARALARLNHPHIVAVHDFGQAGGQPYLVMEFVDGPNLRQVEQAGRLTPQQALEIVPQICEALQFAHNEGVVHRDIKPENILLDKKGRVKITDFGIAKIVGVPAGKVSLTGAKDVLGTPHYMAPEQVEKPSTVDHRADIYSLGVVFYELLTGELPLGKFQPPSRKVQMDVRLDEVVLHALEKEPERRYQQASQVKTDVETIAMTPSSGSSGRPSAPTEDQSRLTSAATIHSMVKTPANWLVATGILNWIAIPLILFVTLGIVAGKGGRVSPALTLLIPLFVMILSSAMIVAGLKMKRLEAYSLAIIGSILAMLITPGNIIGLPIGIWCLVVLCRREVREAFNGKLPPELLGSGAVAASVPRPDRFWRRFAVAIALVLLALILIPVGALLLSITLPALSRAKVKMQQQSEASHVSVTFGPAVERVLNDLDENRGNEALNLTSGQLLSLPADFGQRTAEARESWLNSNRVDLLVDYARDRWGLMSRGVRFRDLREPDLGWGGVWPESEVLEKRENREGTLYLLPANAQPPLTFAFLTANGEQGWLQITGLFTNEPRGMKLRYKLTQLAGGGGGGSVTVSSPDLRNPDADAIRIDVPNRYLAAALAGMDLAAERIKEAAARGQLSEQADVFNHFNELCDQLQGKNQNAPFTLQDWGIQEADEFRTITDSIAALEDASERMRDIARSSRRSKAEREPILKEAATQFVNRYAEFKARLRSATRSGGMGAANRNAQRRFVRLVADKTALTFEGQPASWGNLGALLANVPDRKNTVLEFAFTSDQITVAQQNEWFQKATALARQHGFEYASFIGIHLLGSKGTSSSSARSVPSLTQAKLGEFKVTLTNGFTMEVVAVTRNPRGANLWWQPDGTPLAAPPVEIVELPRLAPTTQSQITIIPQNEFLFYVRRQMPPGLALESFQPRFTPRPRDIEMPATVREIGSQTRASAQLVCFAEPPDTVDYQEAVACGPWEAVSVYDVETKTTRDLERGVMALWSEPRYEQGALRFDVMHDADREQHALRMIARLRSGGSEKLVFHTGVLTGSPAKGFALIHGSEREVQDWLQQVKEMVIERTPWVRGEIRNIALKPRFTAEKASAHTFGPIIERVVSGGGDTRQRFIDFDTGDQFAASDIFDAAEPSPEETQRWVKQKGIDAAGDASPAISGLVGFDMVAVPVPRNEWDMTSARLDYYLATAKPSTPAIMFPKGDMSASYVIQTREGGRGLLQIVGFTQDPNSVSMIIRYKMAKP
ncbi:MAG: serine/threonine protein kinase [Verrucomicrobiae bacterium]|nr:serine/threonine protein kinase [Verrucomicrobiae bacterium]